MRRYWQCLDYGAGIELRTAESRRVAELNGTAVKLI
jgi:hypothetical protein